MSNIEPTEEQRRAAVMHRYKLAVLPDKGYLTDWVRTGDASGRAAFDEVVALARLLAEREAKLREGLARIIEAVHVQMAATALPQPLIDVVRGVYAEHPYALHRIEDLETVCHALQDERDTLRARVAELEARPQFASVSSDGFIATSTGPVHVDDVGSVQDALEKRVAELENSLAACRGKCSHCKGHGAYGGSVCKVCMGKGWVLR